MPRCLLLLQLPRRLGVLGCTLVADDIYKAGPMLPVALATTIAILLRQLSKDGVNRRGQRSALCALLQ